ncbi:MAG: UvrD-helicase domain-containing protein, partial [Thermodesulfobacteriota bacterium]
MSTPVRFDLSRHVSLSASAGSGKTYALTHRLLRMLSGGVNPEQILCTTFTNKATNEMAERLMRTLNRLAGEEPFKGFSSDEAREISELLTGETSLGSGTTDRVRAVAREARKRLLAGYSRLNISTMDSFFNMVLRLFPFEAGVPPDFSIMNEAEEQETFRSSLNRLVAEVLADESDAGLLESLLRSLSQTETNPESMLGRFFSDFLPHRVNISRYMKTAMQGAMTRDTVEALRKEESDTAREVVEACHAFVAALAPHAEALSPSARRAFARCRAAASPMDVTALTPFAGDHYRDYLYFKKAPEDDRIVAAFDRTRQVLRRHVQAKSRFAVGALLYFFQRYLSHADRIKRRDRKLSFSDVERLCFELMVGYGDNDPDFLAGAHDYFYYRIDARVKHLLMDEFQDTNILQWEIFRPIILEITADHEGSFFYVGDPKQAIYRFRGGESRLFYHVREELKNRGIEPDELPVNYRSAQSIVSFVNTVFRYISRTERYDFSPQAGFRKDAGYVEMATVPRGDKESPHSPLYEALSRRIATCHSSGFRYRDMAVLLLDNKTCTEVAEYLEQRGIPAATDKKSSLFDSASIRSVMALLHYLSDPTDDLHLMEFLSQLMKNRPAPERINLLETQPARRMEALALHMGSAHRLLSHLRDIADLVSIRELVVRIIRGFSLGRVFNDPGNLVKLVELAGAFPEAHGASGLRSFLSAVERYGRAVPMAGGTATRSMKPSRMAAS